MLRALRSFLKKPAREDIVLIYRACHGAPDQLGRRDEVRRYFASLRASGTGTGFATGPLPSIGTGAG